MHAEDIKPALYVVPEPLRLIGRYVSDTRHVDALPPLDTHQLAWAAGFFDGEGSTYLTYHGAQRAATPCLEVNQIHPEVLERFWRAVGGIGSMRVRPDKTGRRPHHMWSFYARNWRDTQSILTLLWPYLDVVKRQQAATVFCKYQEAVDRIPKLGISRDYPERYARGIGQWKARLTDDLVREIRILHASGIMTQAEIARKLMVGKATVNHVVCGRTWTHVI